MFALANLKVKIFADGADLDEIVKLAKLPVIKGFTTNPSLMRKAGVTDYKKFALDMLSKVNGRPVSFEVFSDDFDEMELQAQEISGWGENVYVKIPITNSKGEFSGPLVGKLSQQGIQVNVTALMTVSQVCEISQYLSNETRSIVSVFAGRVADTGVDPIPVMDRSVKILSGNPLAELIWASPRELLNIFHADSIGCQIITVTSDILGKLHLIGKDLDVYSLETATMFRDDALSAGYEIPIANSISVRGG